VPASRAHVYELGSGSDVRNHEMLELLAHPAEVGTRRSLAGHFSPPTSRRSYARTRVPRVGNASPAAYVKA
jgi:hypothetical protein